MEQENTIMEYRDIPKFENNPILVLILGVITCGLYLIYWNIKTAEVLNAVSGKDVVSAPIAVFAGLCMPVNIYFYYLVGNDALPSLYERINEKNKDQTVLLMILGFIFPMVAAMIVQGEINKLYEN